MTEMRREVEAFRYWQQDLQLAWFKIHAAKFTLRTTDS